MFKETLASKFEKILFLFLTRTYLSVPVLAQLRIDPATRARIVQSELDVLQDGRIGLVAENVAPAVHVHVRVDRGGKAGRSAIGQTRRLHLMRE